jgi:hypothetical protein
MSKPPFADNNFLLSVPFLPPHGPPTHPTSPPTSSTGGEYTTYTTTFTTFTNHKSAPNSTVGFGNYLTTPEAQRIAQLRLEYPHNPGDRHNLQALIADYGSRALFLPRKGRCHVYWGGVRRATDSYLHEALEDLKDWPRLHGDGSLWVEWV